MATQTKTRTARGTTSKTGAPGANGDAAVIAAADLQPLLDALRSGVRGETGVRLDARKRGLVGQLNKAFNELAQTRERTTDEIVRVATAIGREGRLTDRAELKRAQGTWGTSLSTVNAIIDDLSRPTLEVARVIDAVAEGDLSQKMQLKIEGRAVKGEFLRIGTTVNSMVEQLSSFADEVTRVAREVGTEGKLGGQAQVKGVSGTWKDLTDNVNGMATNLTNQVRNIVEVTTAVANGDLTRKITPHRTTICSSLEARSRCRPTSPCSTRDRRSTCCSKPQPSPIANDASEWFSRARTQTALADWPASASSAGRRSSRIRRTHRATRCRSQR